jgi:hypothetical protein
MAARASGKSFRRWFRFSLATLLTVVTVGCLALGFIANRAQNQRRATTMVERCGGWVLYESDPGTDNPGPTRNLPGPRWLRELLGIDYLANVKEVEGISFSPSNGCEPDLTLLKGTPRLKHLTMVGGLRISEGEYRTLERLPSLRGIGAQWCEVSASDLEHLGRLRNLDRLSFYHANIDEAGMESLTLLHSLKTLSITASNFSDHGMKCIAMLPLKYLDVSDTHITDDGLAYLEGHSTLVALRAENTQLGDEGLRSIATIPNLECLDIHTTRVTDAGLAYLKRTPRLKHLSIDGVSRSALGKLQMALPDCDVDNGCAAVE